MNKNKKILTLEDLENFYSKYKRSTTFSAKKSGYQLAVQIPATFEIDEEYFKKGTEWYNSVTAQMSIFDL